MKKIILIIFVSICVNSTAQNWVPLGQGIKNGVFGVRCVYSDTIADLLYVSGNFNNGGGIGAHGIASWNGIKWDTLGRGFDNYTISGGFTGYTDAMCRYNNKLYTGCGWHVDSLVANGFATWDGSSWDTLHEHPVTPIDMMVYNNELYICGLFDTVGNILSHGLIKWNGTNWSDVHALPNYDSIYVGSSNQIYCMAIFQGNLYVAGNFGAPGTPHHRIVFWNGSQWDSLANGGVQGLQDEVETMVVYNNELYLGGMFSQAGGNVGNYIMKWNGTNWSEVGGGMDYIVRKLKVYHNELYAIGLFSAAGGIPAQYIAKWDGTNWCGFGDTFDNVPTNIEVYHDTIYLGGAFLTINGDTVNHIAKWIGGNYTAGCTTIGVNELEDNEEINIYPNPSTGDFTINLNKEYKNVEIEITNLLGQIIYTTKQKEKSRINITLNEPPGVYFVNVMADERRRVIKLIKE